MGLTISLPDSLVFSCSNMGEMFSTYNRLRPMLPPEIIPEFVAAFKQFLRTYRWEEACERLNGLTVAQVLDEYRRLAGPGVIASGERDGVSYTLYEKPATDEGPA